MIHEILTSSSYSITEGKPDALECYHFREIQLLSSHDLINHFLKQEPCIVFTVFCAHSSCVNQDAEEILARKANTPEF